MSVDNMILNAKQNAIVNATMGTAANFMTMAGLSWQGEVASLCNTGGDLEEWKRRWYDAQSRAFAAMREKLATVERVRALLAEWQARFNAEVGAGVATARSMILQLQTAIDGDQFVDANKKVGK